MHGTPPSTPQKNLKWFRETGAIHYKQKTNTKIIEKCQQTQKTTYPIVWTRDAKVLNSKWLPLH
jgi:hypothetical protein